MNTFCGKIVTLILLILGFQTIYAQQTRKYQGPYTSGTGNAGEATYFYYDGKKPGDQIRHGLFRYVMKFKDGDKRMMHTIEGSYKHGLMDGNWLYSLNTKDFIKEKDGLLYGSVVIKAVFSSGIPDGRWEYQATLRHRKSQGSGSVAFSKEVKENLTVNFKMGLLVDSFNFYSSSGISKQGFCNQMGIFDGECFSREEGIAKITVYKNGIQLAVKTLDSEDNVLTETPDKQNQQLHSLFQKAVAAKQTSTLDFTTDTSDLVSDKGSIMSGIIIQRLFNDNYCLINYIHGNTKVYYEKGILKNELKGLKTIEFKNQISENHALIIGRIKHMHGNIAKAEAEAIKASTGKTISKEATLKITQLKNQQLISAKYACIAGALVQNFIFENALSDACSTCEKKLGKLPVLPAEHKNREAMLSYLLQQQISLEKSALAANEFILKELKQ